MNTHPKIVPFDEVLAAHTRIVRSFNPEHARQERCRIATPRGAGIRIGM